MICAAFSVLPGKPTRLLVAQTTSTSVTLAWFTDTAEPVSFIVEYRPSRRMPGSDQWMTMNDIATIEHTVSGLQPFTEYQMRVIAVGEAGNSDPSDPIEVRTLKAPPGNGHVYLQSLYFLCCMVSFQFSWLS